MEDEVYNIGYVGLDGLRDRIVIEVADSFRKNLRAWKRAILNVQYEKLDRYEANMWEDLVWFISGYLSDMYLDEDIDGGKFYRGLLEEWITVQNELSMPVEKPNYVKSMEERYEQENEQSLEQED